VTEPISPDQVCAAKEKLLPPEVIEAFNELIAKRWNGSASTFSQNSVINLISTKLDLENREIIFKEHLLDVEDIYRAKGWRVTYDKPGYNETYPATFTFRKR
jgi:hypothetical protein